MSKIRYSTVIKKTLTKLSRINITILTLIIVIILLTALFVYTTTLLGFANMRSSSLEKHIAIMTNVVDNLNAQRGYFNQISEASSDLYECETDNCREAIKVVWYGFLLKRDAIEDQLAPLIQEMQASSTQIKTDIDYSLFNKLINLTGFRSYEYRELPLKGI